MANEWTCEALTIHGWRILNENGSEIVRDIYDDQIARQIVREHNAHEALVDAAQFVNTFLNQLEDGLPESDPLTQMRRRYHAPLHAKIDAALELAASKGRTEASLRLSQH